MGRLRDLIGTRFTRLIVLEREGVNADHKPTWKCVCDCGNTKIASSKNLINGHIKSCGCLNKEQRIQNNQVFKTKHGHSKNNTRTRTYITWDSMKQRCLNIQHKDYHRYGGRGIKVCISWINSFENFYKDMGNKPIGLQIDRINNDGDYEPSNCRWVTPKENVNNRQCSKRTI